jgi:hypothetical protein
LIDSQIAEEHIDRLALAARRMGAAQRQNAILDSQDRVLRHHIDVIRLDRHAVIGDDDGHGRISTDHLMQQTFALRAEMGDDHERHAGFFGKALEESLHRRNTTGGGTDADDRELHDVSHSMPQAE